MRAAVRPDRGLVLGIRGLNLTDQLERFDCVPHGQGLVQHDREGVCLCGWEASRRGWIGRAHRVPRSSVGCGEAFDPQADAFRQRMIATVVLFVVVVLTRWSVAVIALALVVMGWVAVYVNSDPMHRQAGGDDPARQPEQPWNVD
jgi:hypothetical protein